ncbi:MAG: RNA-binding protein [Rhodospirillaceae bacterium]|nr:RNA-binding protein [Rhodospirillaceae bacterium]
MAGKQDDKDAERRCIVTGQHHSREEMLRFVVSPTGELVFDVNAKLPGRGLWLWPASDMLHTAQAIKIFAKAAKRAAKAEVKISDDLGAEVERQLLKRSLASLSLAKRAGQVTSGFEKVRARLKKGNVGLLLEASDGADDGKNKIGLLAQAVSPQTPVVSIFSRDNLAAAIGRTEAVHMVLEPGKLAKNMLVDASKLARFTGQELNKGLDIVLNKGLKQEETDKT